MILEDKVRLMTKAAIFEKSEERFAMNVSRYYKKDYVSLHVILVWLSVTLAFGIGIFVTLFYMSEQSEKFLLNFDRLEMGVILLLIGYLILISVFAGIAVTRYTIRYDEAAALAEKQELCLKRLEHLYRRQEKARQPGRISDKQESNESL